MPPQPGCASLNYSSVPKGEKSNKPVLSEVGSGVDGRGRRGCWEPRWATAARVLATADNFDTEREVDERKEKETENVMRAALMHYSGRGGHFTKKYRNTRQIFDKAGRQSCTLLSQRSAENSGKEKRQRYGCQPQLKLTASQM